MVNEREDKKLSITQWVQITTAILTMIASLGLWLVKTASTPSLEVQEIRAQLTELSKEIVTLQLENERFKYQIEDLEQRERMK